MISISIYWIIKQCANNQRMYIKKRALSLYHSLNFSLLFAMIAMMIMLIGFARFPITPQIIVANIGCFSCYYFFYMLLVKNWMIYYKYQWTYYTMQYKWSHIINSTSASTESDNNWYIVNNNKYGNLYYIYKLFGIIFFIFYIIGGGATSFAIYTKFDIIVCAIVAAITMPIFAAIGIFYFYLVKNTPYIDDAYKIHWESRTHAKLLLLWAFCCTLTNASYLIFQDIHAFPVFGTLMNVTLFMMIFVSTAYLAKIQRDINTNTELVNPMRNNSVKVSDQINIDNMLSNEAMIHAFMVHLSTEYSMECLLSYIEFSQYQKYVVNKMNMNDNEMRENDVELINMPDNIPISEIIEDNLEQEGVIDGVNNDNNNSSATFDDKFLDNAKIKAHKLYKKYIKTGCEFEINISSLERGKLFDLLDCMDSWMSYNVNLKDLLMIFEDCKKEMRMLMSYALERFKRSTEFIDQIV